MEQKSIQINTISNNSVRHERADAVANRQLLLTTAESLFVERGVADVTMAEIAPAAGVGKGTLYRRFSNKGDLCLALMDKQMREFQNNMLAELRFMAASGMTSMQQLDYFLNALVSFTAVHMPLLCEVQQAHLLQIQGNTQQPHFWLYMTVHGLLKTAVAVGEIPAYLDIAYIADALLSPLRADIFRFQREVRGFSLERISAGLRGLAQRLILYRDQVSE